MLWPCRVPHCEQVSGTKVDGYYGFCDIRNFRFLTKALGNDIMVLVNIVSFTCARPPFDISK
jgi:hypothetical protein